MNHHRTVWQATIALLIYRRPGVTPGRFKQGIKKTAYQTRPAVPA